MIIIAKQEGSCYLSCMTKHKEERVGELILIVEVLLHAFSPIAKNFGAKNMPQIQFLAYVTLVSILVYGAAMIYSRKWGDLWNKRYVPWLALYTLFMAVIAHGIITYANKYTSAINTTLLTQSEAIFALIIGVLFLKEKAHWQRIVGVLCILLANVLVLFNGDFTFNMADLALVLTPVVFVFGNGIAKRLLNEGCHWSSILFFRGVMGSVILLLVAHFVEGLALPSQQMTWVILAYGVLIYGVGKIAWQLALKRLDISKLTAISKSYPVFSVILAFFILGEVPTLYQYLGLLLTMGGVYFLLQTKSKQYDEEDF